MKWERVDIQALDRQWTSNAQKVMDQYQYLVDTLEEFKPLAQRAPNAHQAILELGALTHRDLEMVKGRLSLINAWKLTAANPARITIGLDELAQIWADPEWNSDQVFVAFHNHICEEYNCKFGLHADPGWSFISDSHWADVVANKAHGFLICYADMPAFLEQTLIQRGEL